MTTEQVISEELFADALHRERRRADRSNQTMGLLLVSPPDAESADASATWKAIVSGLAAAKRDTDVIGWFEQGNAIGVILPDIDAPDPLLARGLDTRIRRQLSRFLGTTTTDNIATRFHFYPEMPVHSSQPAHEIHPLPEPAPSRSRRAIVHDGIKRAIDIAGSAALLILLAPVLLLTAVLVKLKSPGPVFFRQERVGRMMKPFTMLKFRTMRVNADSKIHQEYVSSLIKAKAASHGSGTDTVFKLAADPRVTSIGRILRKTSIDELPQLLNVLRGDMSLVGPRPPLHYEVEQYQRWHCRRVLEAKPGLTGLWQVAGRSRTTFDEMVRLDLRYARTRSLWTDVKILLATPAAVFVGKGAV
jgi:lipopolysaccharide/colanic/teichoic acid biosynthesis glycosyltransferase